MPVQETSVRILKALKEIDEAKHSFEKLMQIRGELQDAYQSIMKDASSSPKDKDKPKSPQSG